MHAEPVLFLSIPHAGPLSVKASFPLTENRTMALTAENVGFLKAD